MFHLTEIKCLDTFGFDAYIYVNTRYALRNLKELEKNTHIPDGLRIMIIDAELSPISFCGTLSPWTYLYRKYFKKSFKNGYRYNWEKELKKYLKTY